MMKFLILYLSIFTYNQNSIDTISIYSLQCIDIIRRLTIENY